MLILFGDYRGTVRESGFHWANPLYARRRGQVPLKTAPPAAAPLRLGRLASGLHQQSGFQTLSTKLSLRANNFSSETLKVNDKRGNTVEIGAVIVWRVEDTAQAVVKLDEERKAAMVSNLLVVVLCGSSDPSPVINTGTPYA